VRTARALLVGALLVALAGPACNEAPPPATGSFSRPSGLAYVTRSSTRADIFVADSQAPGVRILQLQETTLPDNTISHDSSFVPGPVQWFPLAIEVAGFPARLVATEDGQRLYVLGTATTALTVVSIENTKFLSNATDVSTYRRLGSVSLESIAPGGTPIDFVRLPSRGGHDVLAVLFDRGPNAGLVAAIAIDPKQSFQRVMTETASVVASPRTIAFRAMAPSSVLVGSPSTARISMLGLNSTTATAAGTLFRPLPAVQPPLLAGGVVGHIVDAGPSGVVALRADAAYAVLFELEQVSGTTVLARSGRILESPYDPLDPPRNDDVPGRVTLFPALPSYSVSSTVNKIANVSRPNFDFNALDPSIGTTGDEANRSAEAVYVSSLAATATFLVGTPLRLAVTSTVDVMEIEKTVPGETIAIHECPVAFHEPLTCAERSALTKSSTLCVHGLERGVVTLGPDAPLPQIIRVSYQGTIARGTTATLISSTVAAGAVRLEDPAQGATLVSAVPGDAVALNVPCGASGSLAATGTVATATSGLALLMLSGPVLGCFAATASVADVSYEVFPSTRTVVAVRVDPLGFPITVLGRAPVVPDINPGEEKAVLTGTISLTLSSTPSFSCTAGPPPVAPSCDTDADCSGGATCAAPAVWNCAGTCTCPAGGTGCLGSVRVCSGVVLRVGHAHANVLDLTTGLSVTPSFPDQVVYSPLRKGWFQSFPGARSLIEWVVDVAVGFKGFVFH
jgi:hypothetical protein